MSRHCPRASSRNFLTLVSRSPPGSWGEAARGRSAGKARARRRPTGRMRMGGPPAGQDRIGRVYAGSAPSGYGLFEGERPCGLLDAARAMATGRASSSEADLYRRKEWITTLARGVSCALALAALVLLWNSPRTRSLPATLTG